MNLPSRRWIRTLLKLYGFPKSSWSRVCVWFVLVREQLGSLKSKFQSSANAASWPWYVEICNIFVVFLLERFSVQNEWNILTRSTIKCMKDNWPLINIWQTLFWKCYHVGFFFSHCFKCFVIYMSGYKVCTYTHHSHNLFQAI